MLNLNSVFSVQVCMVLMCERLNSGLSFVHLTRFLTLSSNHKNWVFPLLELGFLILSWVLTILELSCPIFGTGFFAFSRSEFLTVGSGFMIIILEFHTQKSLHMLCHREYIHRMSRILKNLNIWVFGFLELGFLQKTEFWAKITIWVFKFPELGFQKCTKNKPGYQ